MCGMIHIYCGDGKGKTTSAVGLAIRAAGAKKKVLFAQFLKNGDSSEVICLEKTEGIETCFCKNSYGFFNTMDDREKERAKKDYTLLFEQCVTKSATKDMLILDEAVSAVNTGMLDEDKLVCFLKNKPRNLEVILTGRNPGEKLTENADYITLMQNLRHPYDKGIPARYGIEF